MPYRPRPGGAVERQVLNAITGEPVKKANIVLRRADSSRSRSGPPQSYATSTDTAGRFSMKAIDSGQYRLSVDRTGFVSTEYGARASTRQGTTLSLDAGQELQDLTIRLTPHSVVTGRVVDEDGEPVAYAQIQLQRYRYSQGRKQLTPVSGASTNDLGEYRVFGLPAGKYYISASYRNRMMSDPAMADRSQGPEEGYVPTYYPGTTDPAAAAMVEVPLGGELRSINFTLAKTRTVRVRGRVQYAGGASGRQHITIMLVPRGQMGFSGGMNRTSPDPQGGFEILACAWAPTPWWRRSSSGDTAGAREPLDVGNANLENLNITITPGMELAGQVSIDGGGTANLSGLRVSLRPREPGPMFGPTSAGSVKEGGAFTLSNVTPDQYDFQISGLPGGHYVKSIRMADQDVLEAGLNVQRGAAGPVSVVLAPNAGQAEGVVLDGKQQPAAGATVVLVPETRRRDKPQFYKTATADQNGHFTLQNIDPGDYKLFAWEDVEAGRTWTPIS